MNEIQYYLQKFNNDKASHLLPIIWIHNVTTATIRRVYD